MVGVELPRESERVVEAAQLLFAGRDGRIALTLVLAAVLFSYLNPAINFIHTYRATTAAKIERHRLQAENTRLHHRVQSADQPGVLERAARRQGLIAPAERPYAVRGLNG